MRSTSVASVSAGGHWGTTLSASASAVGTQLCGPPTARLIAYQVPTTGHRCVGEEGGYRGIDE